MKNILITGGTGLLGQALTQYFLNKKYTVKWLTRNLNKKFFSDVELFQWNLEKKIIEERAFENTEVVIHLAGAGIADKRWTSNYKKEILDSRIQSSHLLADYIKKRSVPLQCFIGASAVGYYGMTISDKIYTEEDEYGNDFLGLTCKAWEKSYEKIQEQNIRTCIVRTGLVLSPKGGLYKKLSPIFKMGVGSVLGNGKQNMPWIHIEDWCGIVDYLIEHQHCNGIYNAVQGSVITNKEFSEVLAHSFNKKTFSLHIPEWLLNILMGEMAKMLYTGVKVSSEKIRNCGYKFKYENLEDIFISFKN